MVVTLQHCFVVLVSAAPAVPAVPAAEQRHDVGLESLMQILDVLLALQHDQMHVLLPLFLCVYL